MEKVSPTTDDMFHLTQKLISFKSLSSIAFRTRELYIPKDAKDGKYGITYHLDVFVKNDNECEKLQELIRRHFTHIKNVAFFVQFLVPGLRKHVWKQTKIHFCI